MKTCFFVEAPQLYVRGFQNVVGEYLILQWQCLRLSRYDIFNKRQGEDHLNVIVPIGNNEADDGGK